MTDRTLRPWFEIVPICSDVETGALTGSVFAIDLGAIASSDPNTPAVNRDPETFFRATYQNWGRDRTITLNQAG